MRARRRQLMLCLRVEIDILFLRRGDKRFHLELKISHFWCSCIVYKFRLTLLSYRGQSPDRATELSPADNL